MRVWICTWLGANHNQWHQHLSCMAPQHQAYCMPGGDQGQQAQLSIAPSMRDCCSVILVTCERLPLVGSTAAVYARLALL